MKKRSVDTLTLDGGCLCFHLVNTVSDRVKMPAQDYIGSYAELLQWARKANALPARQIDLLEKLAVARPREAAAVLEYFRECREALYRFFSAIAARRPPGKAAADVLNRHIRQAMRRFEFDGDHLPIALQWQTLGADLREPVWAALRSAWEVLHDQDQLRIKECEACGWLFLDRTRNKRKRWCNPATCGSADKAKRYYRRKKDRGSPAD